MSSLYDDAVLVMIPSAFKAGTLYSVKPNTAAGDFTVVRNATATRINSLGVREIMAIDVPLLNYSSIGGCPVLLTQPQSINLYLNSATLVTQDVVTTATSYTVSFEGTGSVAFTGAYTGSLAAAGAAPLDRVSLTFTSTVGTLTSTVTGSVINAQIENLSYDTTYIATVGSTVTRVADAVGGAGDAATFASVNASGVLYAEISAFANFPSSARIISISNETSANRTMLFYNNTLNTIRTQVIVGGATQCDLTYGVDITDFHKVAIRWETPNGVDKGFELWADGQVRDFYYTGSVYGTSVLTTLSLSNWDGGLNAYGNANQVAVYNYLTDAQMIELTTP